MRRAASAQLNLRRPHEAGRAQLRPPVERVQDRAGEVALVGEDRGVARHLDERGVGRGDDGRPARHRLQHRQPEALVPGRDDERGRLAVEPRELLVIHVAAHVGAEPAQLVAPAPAPAPGPTTTTGMPSSFPASTAARGSLRRCTEPTTSR